MSAVSGSGDDEERNVVGFEDENEQEDEEDFNSEALVTSTLRSSATEDGRRTGRLRRKRI